MIAMGPSGSCVERYEALRGGALGDPVAPELRGGLAVLLRRGMWAWMRAVSAEPDSQRPQVSEDIARLNHPHDLVHLLADLASSHCGVNP